MKDQWIGFRTRKAALLKSWWGWENKRLLSSQKPTTLWRSTSDRGSPIDKECVGVLTYYAGPKPVGPFHMSLLVCFAQGHACAFNGKATVFRPSLLDGWLQKLRFGTSEDCVVRMHDNADGQLWGKSLIHAEKRRGSRAEPCGTMALVGALCEGEFPTFAVRVLPAGNFWNVTDSTMALELVEKWNVWKPLASPGEIDKAVIWNLSVAARFR